MKKALIIFWAIVLAYTAYTLVHYFKDINRNNKLYQELRDSYNTETMSEQEALSSSQEKNNRVILQKYHSILSINPDTAGWIKVPNTRIDYPVLKTEDNNFYIYHNIQKEISRAGSIFMDFRNQGEAKDVHTIIYGHNMKDGSMFRDLIKYKNQSFLNENPIIEFNTLYEELKWEIFSVYVTKADFNYIQTDFASTEDYENFLQSIKARSIFETDVYVSGRDSILTLSTCSYNFDNARLVVHARKVQ